MLARTDTIAAVATPLGTSAIAVVRASGPLCRELACALFGGELTARVGTHADYRDAAGVLVDDVLATFFAGPNSYTGEDGLEISCHGNPYIARRILDDLLRRGCRAAEPGEFTQRAFLNGRIDLSQAEAVMDLIHARSERALAAANQQLRGALGRRMEGLIEGTIQCLALVEAYIDFPDEDLPPENRQALLERISRLEEESGRLLATGAYGEILRSGIRTVIIGEPNAGKSSLLNLLVGKERALVSAEPGTTRDYLEETVTIDGHLLRLIDTAGLNPEPGEIERRGIEKTVEQSERADLFLWVLDGTRAVPQLPESIRRRLSAANSIAVINKADLPGCAATVGAEMPEVSLSARTGAGAAELVRRISSVAAKFQSEVGEDAVAINSRHAEALREARAGLVSARTGIMQVASPELIASELRGALEAFGQISGRVDHERVLDHMFSTFCIGK